MLNRSTIFIYLFVLTTCLLYSGNENLRLGTRQAGMGYTGLTTSDMWAVNYNQAGLSTLANVSVGFSLENKYLISGLNLGSIALVMPTKTGVFALSATHFGNGLYNENKFGLAFAKTLSERFHVGIQLDYLTANLLEETYGNNHSFTVEGGIIFNVSDKLSFGSHIFNPLMVKFASYDNERIPVILGLGCSYSFSEQINMLAEIEKDISFKPNYKCGLEYKPNNSLFVRLGVVGLPDVSGLDYTLQNTFGFGVNYKGLQLDFSTSIHQVLGVSPQLSVIFEIK